MRLVPWHEALPAGMELFRLDLELDASESESSPHLTHEERDQALRFLHRADRVRFSQTRAAARGLLGERLGCRPGEVPLVRGRHGKPFVGQQYPSAPFFNVSHSGRHALIALADARAVRQLGVDIEQRRHDLPLEILLDLAFTGRESAEIRGAGDAAEALYQRWVGKEALLKAVGVGVAGHLPSVGIHPGAGRQLLIDCQVPEWTCFEAMALAAPPGYAAALAWRIKEAT
jgi:4'-phosphopantetheinyl transferase